MGEMLSNQSRPHYGIVIFRVRTEEGQNAFSGRVEPLGGLLDGL